MPHSRSSFTIRPIGHVENTCEDLLEPRRIRPLESRIVLDPEWVEGLHGLEEQKRILVVFYFHRLAEERIELIQHRRGKPEEPRKGVFALRTPRRPNSIGVTEVELLKIEGRVLTVTGLDAVNSTPVLDIKPVMGNKKENSNMRLQLAIDVASTQTALEMASQIHDVVDILEVGTPVILREGLLPVRAIKQRFPHLTVLADCKIVDGGDLESSDAFEAGADLVTVLAVANNATIRAVVNQAKQRGREVMADMICVQDVKKRALELDDLGVDYICLHTAVDVQNTGKTPFEELEEVLPLLRNAKAAVAGGIQLDSVDLVRAYQPGIVVVGSALTQAANLRSAVIEMKTALQG